MARGEQGIAVIAVRENKNRMRNKLEELPFGETKVTQVQIKESTVVKKP